MVQLLGANAHLSLPIGAAPDTHLKIVDRFDGQGCARSASGENKLQVREIKLQSTGAYGKPVPHIMIVLYDPQSRAYSWNVSLEESSPATAHPRMQAYESCNTVFLKGDQLVVFMTGIPPGPLYVNESHGRALNMNDAEQKALESVAVLNDPPGNVDVAKQWTEVPLTGLSADFTQTPGNAIPDVKPQLTNVRWDGEHWHINLQARWTEVITLDANYNLVAMKKVE